MGKHNQIVGKEGEGIAAEFLRSLGMSILVRNFHIRGGEIDIIAKEGETYVFVEVKTRRSLRYGSGAEAVDSKKQQALLRAAQVYLYQQGLYEVPVRFDVIEIHLQEKLQLRHLKNVIFS